MCSIIHIYFLILLYLNMSSKEERRKARKEFIGMNKWILDHMREMTRDSLMWQIRREHTWICKESNPAFLTLIILICIPWCLVLHKSERERKRASDFTLSLMYVCVCVWMLEKFSFSFPTRHLYRKRRQQIKYAIRKAQEKSRTIKWIFKAFSFDYETIFVLYTFTIAHTNL